MFKKVNGVKHLGKEGVFVLSADGSVGLFISLELQPFVIFRTKFCYYI